MKTKEELNALKKEIETLSGKLRQLSPEELEFVSGGFKVAPNDSESSWRKFVNWLNKLIS